MDYAIISALFHYYAGRATCRNLISIGRLARVCTATAQYARDNKEYLANILTALYRYENRERYELPDGKYHGQWRRGDRVMYYRCDEFIYSLEIITGWDVGVICMFPQVSGHCFTHSAGIDFTLRSVAKCRALMDSLPRIIGPACTDTDEPWTALRKTRIVCHDGIHTIEIHPEVYRVCEILARFSSEASVMCAVDVSFDSPITDDADCADQRWKAPPGQQVAVIGPYMIRLISTVRAALA